MPWLSTECTSTAIGSHKRVDDLMARPIGHDSSDDRECGPAARTVLLQNASRMNDLRFHKRRWTISFTRIAILHNRVMEESLMDILLQY